MTSPFTLVGLRPQPPIRSKKTLRPKGVPWISLFLLSAICLCCLLAELLMTKDPTYLDLANCSIAPNGEFLFGTDTLGRDIFSGIWYGGRISLTIGFLSTLISTAVGVLYGTVSGLASRRVDALLMRFAELFLSIPGLLPVLFLQAILGQSNVLSLSLVLGLTGWASLAKVIRGEVRSLRSCDYVIASRCMGGGFFHILRKHLVPNFLSSTIYMVIMNIRGAIVAESTLSFMGLGLPPEIISWGSMLSLAEGALMSGNWWIILIPGAFLVTLLMSLTALGNYLHKITTPGHSHL